MSRGILWIFPGGCQFDFRGLRSEWEQELQIHQEFVNARWNTTGLKKVCPRIFQLFFAEYAQHVSERRSRFSAPLAQEFGWILLSRFVPSHNRLYNRNAVEAVRRAAIVVRFCGSSIPRCLFLSCYITRSVIQEEFLSRAVSVSNSASCQVG